MWSIYYCAKGGVLHVLKGNIFNLFTFNPIPQSCKSEASSADILFCSLEATHSSFLSLLEDIWKSNQGMRCTISRVLQFLVYILYHISMHATTCWRQISLLTWHLVHLLLQHVVHLFIQIGIAMRCIPQNTQPLAVATTFGVFLGPRGPLVEPSISPYHPSRPRQFFLSS